MKELIQKVSSRLEKIKSEGRAMKEYIASLSDELEDLKNRYEIDRQDFTIPVAPTPEPDVVTSYSDLTSGDVHQIGIYTDETGAPTPVNETLTKITNPNVITTDPLNPVISFDYQDEAGATIPILFTVPLPAPVSAVNAIDFFPTGNPNEFSVNITYTDDNGITQTITDTTPVTLTSPLIAAEGITIDNEVIKLGDEATNGGLAEFTTHRYVNMGNFGISFGSNPVFITGANVFSAAATAGSVTGNRSGAIAVTFPNVSGDRSLAAAGNNIRIDGDSSFGSGNAVRASGLVSSALGNRVTASGTASHATNDGNQASGYASSASGKENTAGAYGETVCGVYALNINGNGSLNIPTDFAHRVGVGSSTTNRADGHQVRKDGENFIPFYPETRDDSATVEPKNFLYTDAVGRMLSAKREANPSLFTVNQVGHNLPELTPVYQDDTGTWLPAQANSTETSAIAIVSSVIDTDNFTLLMTGGIIKSPGHGLSTNTHYYLDDTTAGALVPVASLTGSAVLEQGILNIIDADTVQYLHWPAEQIGADTASPSEPQFFKAGGSVDLSGNAEEIQGATVSRIAQGQYQITFNSPATSATYPVLATMQGLPQNDDYQWAYLNRTVNGFQIEVREQDNGGAAGVLRDSGFSFFVPKF